MGRRLQLGGRYVESAEGTETGEMEMRILVGPGITEYAQRNVSTKEFLAFLRQDVRVPFLNHLWIDNEGEWSWS